MAPDLYRLIDPTPGHEAGMDVVHSMDTLERLPQNFHSALRLFDFAMANMRLPEPDKATREQMNKMWEVRKYMRGWPMIAAREGAFLIYDFKHAMEAVKRAMREFAPIKEQADWGMVKYADQLFQARFPQWKLIRDACGHTGEMLTSEEKWRQNSLKRGISDEHMKVAPGNHVTELRGRSFGITTFGGEFASYEVSEETHTRLWEVYAAIFESMNGDGGGKTPEERVAIACQLVRQFNG